MARGDDGDGAMHTYTTQRTHARLTYMLSSAHPHQHACTCMHALPSPPHSYATLYTQPPPAPHPTIHITPTYTICCTTAHPRTLQHTQHPTHCNTTHATTYRSLRVPPRSRRDRRQETAQTHITPTAITTTMTMCDDM